MFDPINSLINYVVFSALFRSERRWFYSINRCKVSPFELIFASDLLHSSFDMTNSFCRCSTTFEGPAESRSISLYYAYLYFPPSFTCHHCVKTESLLWRSIFTPPPLVNQGVMVWGAFNQLSYASVPCPRSRKASARDRDLICVFCVKQRRKQFSPLPSTNGFSILLIKSILPSLQPTKGFSVLLI